MLKFLIDFSITLEFASFMYRIVNNTVYQIYFNIICELTNNSGLY